MAFVSAEYREQWLGRIPESNRIPRVSISDFIERSYNLNLPCIITDLPKWQCCNWSPEYLCEIFKDYIHNFRYSDASGRDSGVMTMPLKDYIEQLFIINKISDTPIGLPIPPSATEKVFLNLFSLHFTIILHLI